jgi:hypothetical protein
VRSVRVLLGECVDRRLANELVGHDVQTVPAMGWAGKRNGDLLTLAGANFDAFVTVDRNLPKQHDVSKLSFALIVLVARSNRLADLRPLAPRLVAALESAKPGQLIEIAAA